MLHPLLLFRPRPHLAWKEWAPTPLKYVGGDRQSALKSKRICLAGSFFPAWCSKTMKPEFKQALRVLIQGVGVAIARSLSGPLSSLPHVIC